MNDNEKKEYIVNLSFGTWQNQLWFCAADGCAADRTDGNSHDEAFENAERSLDAVGDDCKNSNEFFSRAVEHFESYGFARIQK